MAQQAAALAFKTGRSALGSWRQQAWVFARRKPLGGAGAGVVLALSVVAIFASLIATHNPLVIDIPNRLQGPSWSHFFGTDELGRDVFSRIVFATRVSLIVGFGGAAITIALALMLGVISGYYQGKADILIQRVVDAFMSLPTMVVLLMAVFLLGKSLLNVVIVLGVISAPAASRVIRGVTISTLTSQYFDAARALGSSDTRTILRHLIPNIAAPVLVIASIAVGGNILAEAFLSFLGLGIEPPDPTWGNMLSFAALGSLTENPWLALFPGAFITLAVFSVNVLGDALRDELDPSRRGL